MGIVMISTIVQIVPMMAETAVDLMSILIIVMNVNALKEGVELVELQLL